MGEIVQQNNVDIKNINLKLKKIEEETGCPIKQINGQRIFGPPIEWKQNKPRKGSEVFLAKIPRTMLEDQLLPIFSKYGRIYQMRLMLEFSGVNRGFAFVTYSSPEEATKVVQKLNNYEIMPGHRIMAFISIDNCRLFVANIPFSKSVSEIFLEFQRMMNGLQRVIMGSNYRGTISRGFVFLEFDCHKNALEVRKKFWPYKLSCWNRKLFVDWAIPNQYKSKSHQLIIRGLTAEITTAELANVIYSKITNNSLLGLKMRIGEAIVTFRSRHYAKEAFEKLKGLTVRNVFLKIYEATSQEENRTEIETSKTSRPLHRNPNELRPNYSKKNEKTQQFYTKSSHNDLRTVPQYPVSHNQRYTSSHQPQPFTTHYSNIQPRFPPPQNLQPFPPFSYPEYQYYYYPYPYVNFNYNNTPQYNAQPTQPPEYRPTLLRRGSRNENSTNQQPKLSLPMAKITDDNPKPSTSKARPTSPCNVDSLKFSEIALAKVKRNLAFQWNEEDSSDEDEI